MMNPRHPARAAAHLALIGLAALGSRPVVAGRCELSQVAAFPITMTNLRPLMSAQIDGSDVQFILDSGAFYSMLSAASAAELKLRLQPAPFGFYVRGTNGTADVDIATVPVFTLAGVPLHHVQFLVGGTDTGPNNVGILGQNILHLADVEYDLGQGMVRLLKPKDCPGSLAYWANGTATPYSVVKLDDTTPRQTHTVTKAYINGKEIRVLFDTGAGLSMLSLKAAARAGITPESAGVVPAGQTYGIGKRVLPSFIAPFASFKIGEEEIRNTRLRIAEFDELEADMLLGADFFLSHRIYVANGQGKLYFSYNGGPVFNLTGAKSAGSKAPGPAAVADPEPGAAAAGSQSGTDPVGEDPADLSRRGGAAASRRDFAAALIDLNRACELAPDNADYFHQRGLVHWQLKQRTEAKADFDRALQLKPDLVPALLSRAEWLLQSGDKAGASHDLDVANAAAAPQAEVRFTMAQLYQASGLPDSAIAQWDLWTAAHPQDARLTEALNSRCWIRALSGSDLGLALKDCDGALKRVDKSSASYAHIANSRGLVRLRLGDYDKALADFDVSLKVDPKNAWSWYGRGIVKLRKNDTAGGQADLSQATAISPKIAEIADRYGIRP